MSAQTGTITGKDVSIRLTEVESSCVKFHCAWPDIQAEVFVRALEGDLKPNGAALISAGLLPAMSIGANLSVDSPVSKQFAKNAHLIRDIYHEFSHQYRLIDISAPIAEPEDMPDHRKSAVFFTGGVDSFYSALNHSDKIDTLIFVHGFDVKLDDIEGRQRRADKLRKAAEGLGKEFLEVETNLRQDFSRHLVNWEMYHGAALFAVGHLLSHRFRRIYIAGSYSYARLRPWGSHPVLDPLFSNENIEFIHDGGTLRRLGKAKVVSQNEIARETMHVCWEKSAYENCCRCEKCIRTMCALRALQMLDKCPAFPKPIDFRKAKYIEVSPNIKSYEGILEYMNENNVEDPELRQLLKGIITRRYNRGVWQILRKIVRAFRALNSKQT